jgi:antitoxin CptB
MSTEAPTTPAPLDPRRKRILFRATHRGTHENDLMIGGYLAPRLAEMAESELAEIEALLELPDPDLADWLSGRRPIPPAHDNALLRRMRAAGNGGQTRSE